LELGPELARGALGRARPDTPAVLETLRTVARDAKIRLREGILLAGKGPAYETSAEIRMARRFGADAACMSSAHEMDLAAALGLKTGAVSCITNYGTGLSPHALTHHEVEQVAGEPPAGSRRCSQGPSGACNRATARLGRPFTPPAKTP
jgi:purine-nucleoside phosphorylase